MLANITYGVAFFIAISGLLYQIFQVLKIKFEHNGWKQGFKEANVIYNKSLDELKVAYDKDINELLDLVSKEIQNANKLRSEIEEQSINYKLNTKTNNNNIN